MRILVECLADNASVNIADRLRELADWKDTGTRFEDHPVLAQDELRLVTIDDMHITNEDLDQRLPAELSEPEVVVFLSRHRAQSGTPSLTVHPIGNWSGAPYGGREGAVVPTAPALMGGLLRFLAEHAPDGYEVSLEATHHGPHMRTPCIFLELGSTQDQWDDPDAGRVLARAVLEARHLDAPAVLWIGGGHYCPQLTDLVLDGAVAPGHVVAGWAANDELTDATLEQAAAGIPDVAGFVLQRNATTAEQAVADRARALGIPEFDPGS